MSARPLVVADTPLWSGRWDYGLERHLIEQAGASLVVPADPIENDLVLPIADVVLRGGRRLDGGVLSRCSRCVGVVTYSVGLDGIDEAAASSAGIAVRNVPGYCTDEVSDHAVLLLLASIRRLPHWTASAARRTWLHPEDQLTVPRLRGLTVGIVGAGRIGQEVARKSRAFGMVTIAHDPYLEQPIADLQLVDMDVLLARSDAVVICASAASTARPIVDAAAIEKLGRPAPVLVNIARGSLVDEQALAAALKSGRVRAAALDVRAVEPPDPANDPLADAPNLILTPHVGAASREATDELRRGVAAAAIELLIAAGRIHGAP